MPCDRRTRRRRARSGSPPGRRRLVGVRRPRRRADATARPGPSRLPRPADAPPKTLSRLGREGPPTLPAPTDEPGPAEGQRDEQPLHGDPFGSGSHHTEAAAHAWPPAWERYGRNTSAHRRSPRPASRDLTRPFGDQTPASSAYAAVRNRPLESGQAMLGATTGSTVASATSRTPRTAELMPATMCVARGCRRGSCWWERRPQRKRHRESPERQMPSAKKCLRRAGSATPPTRPSRWRLPRGERN